MSVTASLHPIWAKALGIAAAPHHQTPDPATTAVNGASPSEGWQVIHAVNPRPGAPVAIKKQLGPNLWMSTTVRPGDPRYPSALQA